MALAMSEAMTQAIRERAVWDRLHAGIEPPTSADDAACQHAELFERLLARRSRQPARRVGQA